MSTTYGQIVKLTEKVRVQIGVIYALFIRDALARYGHESLGFFWIIAEPLLFTVGIMILWNIIGEGHGKIAITAFALTAYTMLTLFRHMSLGFVYLLRHNAGILFHSNVSPLDLLVSRGLIETVGCLGTFFVVYVPLALLGVIDPMRDPLLLFGAWFLAAWYSFSFGLVVEGLAELNETVERVIPAVMYLTLPLTGAFTMQSWLPDKLRNILSYAPLVNLMEMYRCGMFNGNVTTYWNLPYILYWCLGQTVVGLLLIENAREHIRID
ncbi:MAG: ABC transporter permease [Methylovirgula sp.]